MKRCAILVLPLLLVASVAPASLAQGNAARGLEKLKSLAGDWQARRADGTPVEVSYRFVSGGSAVLETLAPANEPEMVTLYHLDGDDIVLTHYCSAGNQPRLRAERAAGDSHSLEFHFADATNLAGPSAGHINDLSLTFLEDGSVTQVWTWVEDGQSTQTTYDLKRKKPL
ncbi:MAG TPA: hypothetical protein VIC59_11815 [Gemmatimonadota bacterium]|jgi:hypothetical protein